jgi:hypothetical protein
MIPMATPIQSQMQSLLVVYKQKKMLVVRVQLAFVETP